MTNDLHLALQAGEVSLSVGMQNLSFRYTRYVNSRLKRVGYLFQGRFKAFLVDQDSYGLGLVRYIHLNPVRAGMVSQAGAYPWSSHRAYLGRGNLPWLTTEWVLGQFGARITPARTRFAAFVDSGSGEGHVELFYGGQADSRVVGEVDFLNKVIGPTLAVLKPPPPASIVEHVCNASRLTPTALRSPGRSRQAAQARTLVAWLAVHTRCCTLAEVAQHFGRSPSTMSHLLARLDKLSRNSDTVAEALQSHLHAFIQA